MKKSPSKNKTYQIPKFAVVDLETTGNHASGNAIIEVGIVLMDGIKTVKEFHSLVNPGRNVPGFITGLTGIDQNMLMDSPSFQEVASVIEEITRDRILVAHNINFDYNFLMREMEACSISFSRQRICTLKAARNHWPGLSGYSLTTLCKIFNIEVVQKHRALHDARSAAILLQKILNDYPEEEWEGVIKNLTKRPSFPAGVPEEEILRIPPSPGVYHFFNHNGKIIYIGKAKNLRNRVRSHFTSTKDDPRKQLFQREVNRVEYHLTGTIEIAGLLEDEQIKHYWPVYNVAQKGRIKLYGIIPYENRCGDVRLGIREISSGFSAIGVFPSSYQAKNWLMKQLVKWHLPLSIMGIFLEDTDVENYKIPDLNAISGMIREALGSGTCIYPGPGRTSDELSFIFMENAIYAGYGFFPASFVPSSVNELEPFLHRQKPTTATQAIINVYLSGSDPVYFESANAEIAENQ